MTNSFRFRPATLRWFPYILQRGVPIQQRFNVCLSCGLVWSSVSPEAVRTLLEKHGTKEAKALLSP